MNIAFSLEKLNSLVMKLSSGEKLFYKAHTVTGMEGFILGLYQGNNGVCFHS